VRTEGFSGIPNETSKTCDNNNNIKSENQEYSGEKNDDSENEKKDKKTNKEG
jgi:hypothetical protein